jgi:hypothetical protein
VAEEGGGKGGAQITHCSAQQDARAGIHQAGYELVATTVRPDGVVACLTRNIVLCHQRLRLTTVSGSVRNGTCTPRAVGKNCCDK